MDPEPEVIKQEIDETASSLKDKLEILEHEVLGTVKGATESVEDTISNVKETVQETISSVKETVQETVQTVKRTFDLRYQTEQHPWLMVGGATAAGFVAGLFLGGRRSSYAGRPQGYARPGRDYTREQSFGTSRYGTAAAGPNGGSSAGVASSAASSAPAESSGPGLFGRLRHNFEGEIEKVKGMAIGALFGVVRDMAKRALPPSLAPKVDEVMNSFTEKLGGEPIREPVVQMDDGHESRSSYEGAMRR